ncbi:MAG: bifunctional D-glycero-beta-D-manno-heptose-7-phosphate kinase/D-glycero-beta-D-manno-heptose 1-phosphate adenylyltransferase HldE [Desulfobacterales bacterium]
MTTPYEFKPCRILVVGDIILDVYYWGEVSRISPEAPVPVVHVQNKTKTLGGAGNVALNLAGLGCRPFLLSVRGADEAGQQLKRILQDHDVTHHLVTVDHHPTTLKTRVIGQGQQLIRLDEEARRTISPETQEEIIRLFEEQLCGADAVILSDYGKGMLWGDLCRQIIERCAAKTVPVFVDPKGNRWERYRGATCITPNLNEFFQVCDCDDKDPEVMQAAAQTLIQELDLTYLMVTRGAKGMSLFGREIQPLHIPTKAREVFDVSGAGDTVIATLAAAVSNGLNISQAAELTNLAAGVVVGKVGTQPIRSVELRNALWNRQMVESPKVCDRQGATAIIDQWHRDRQQIVFTNGCFDILHVGHIKLLQQAAEQGDKLVVGLNSDQSVRGLKGPARPIMPEDERAALLSSINSVDLVVLFDEPTPIELIQRFRPHILVKGDDYTPDKVVGKTMVESWGGRVALIPLIKGISTTRVIEWVKNRS